MEDHPNVERLSSKELAIILTTARLIVEPLDLKPQDRESEEQLVRTTLRFFAEYQELAIQHRQDQDDPVV